VTKETLQDLLVKEIAISDSLGIEVTELREGHLQLTLPLVPNFNHKKTMFGGSLYAGCALAAYGLFLFDLRGRDINTNEIVISHGEIKYLLPATADSTIEARWKSNSDQAQFLKVFSAKGKAKVEIHCSVFCQGNKVAEFVGHFVAKKSQ
jgi:thioesterase domain-containing protein